MNNESTRVAIWKAFKILLVVVLATFVVLSIYMVWRVRRNADKVLREAKNVRMALSSADVEMYASGKTIYNPHSKNGLEDGVKEKVDSLVESKGTYSVTSYNSTEHELTGMTYREGNYIVYFSRNGDDISWNVNMIINVYHYDESEK